MPYKINQFVLSNAFEQINLTLLSEMSNYA